MSGCGRDWTCRKPAGGVPHEAIVVRRPSGDAQRGVVGPAGRPCPVPQARGGDRLHSRPNVGLQVIRYPPEERCVLIQQLGDQLHASGHGTGPYLRSPTGIRVRQEERWPVAKEAGWGRRAVQQVVNLCHLLSGNNLGYFLTERQNQLRPAQIALLAEPTQALLGKILELPAKNGQAELRPDSMAAAHVVRLVEEDRRPSPSQSPSSHGGRASTEPEDADGSENLIPDNERGCRRNTSHLRTAQDCQLQARGDSLKNHRQMAEPRTWLRETRQQPSACPAPSAREAPAGLGSHPCTCRGRADQPIGHTPESISADTEGHPFPLPPSQWSSFRVASLR